MGALLPEINILGFELQTFGLMLALALVSSGVLVGKRLKELGLPFDWVYEIMFCAGLGGIAGAKIWYVVEKGDLGSLFSGTGLVFYGGAIGGALAVMAYARYRGFLDYRGRSSRRRPGSGCTASTSWPTRSRTGPARPSRSSSRSCSGVTPASACRSWARSSAPSAS